MFEKGLNRLAMINIHEDREITIVKIIEELSEKKTVGISFTNVCTCEIIKVL